MGEEKSHICIIAGEASGDMHAAHLVEALRAKNPNLTFSGLGGPQMQASGVHLYEDMTQMAIIGFVEVLKHYPRIKTIFNLILKKIDETKAKTVILVDYPGFNLRLAKKLHERGIKVIYYISPQVWAWKQQRVHFIKKYVDQMLVLFKFEIDFYARFDYKVDFIGHPLSETVKVEHSKNDLFKAANLKQDRLTIGLLPGSREKEIERHLPVMLEAAKTFQQKHPHSQFVLIKAPTIAQSTLENMLKDYNLPIQLVDQNIYDYIHACDGCIVASGTATLETAILNTPMVVIYKTSFITWALANLFVKIPHIGLVNVVAGKRIVPECIQYDANANTIASTLEQIILDQNNNAKIKNELALVKKSLGGPGASERAAEAILRKL